MKPPRKTKYIQDEDVKTKFQELQVLQEWTKQYHYYKLWLYL